MSQAYRAGEFAPDTERIIAQDHLACELSFMRHLVGREMAAWDRKDAEGARALRAQQAAFLEDHLAQWVGSFAKAVERFSETDFYRGLARMTCAWVEMDAASLASAQQAAPCGREATELPIDK